MTRILITGANGYIGRHVINALSKDMHWEITATDLTFKDGWGDKISFVEGDILALSQHKDLYDRLNRPEVCIHLAWKDGFTHNASSHIDCLPAHFNFLQNLVEHGCKQLVVAGSFREYGPCNGCVSEDHPLVAENYYAWAKISLYQLLEIYLHNKTVILQWLRFFTPYGDDEHNNSILSKIIRWEAEGKQFFPFTEGKEQYDFIHVDELARQIVAIASQTEITGAINCCSGKPSKLKDKVEELLRKGNFKIRPQYGAFPTRQYDSSVIYGDNTKVQMILKTYEKKL